MEVTGIEFVYRPHSLKLFAFAILLTLDMKIWEHIGYNLIIFSKMFIELCIVHFFCWDPERKYSEL